MVLMEGVGKAPIFETTPRHGGNKPGLYRKKFRAFGGCLVLLVLSLCTFQLSSILSWLRDLWVPGVPIPQASDPAFGWKDDVWPLRPHQHWDISTDFPHPRALKYDVEEGTWLRLDVSPSGEIIFDMLGDIYCLPSEALENAGSPDTYRALPVLTGVPYDSDPHFSPNGDRLVFRSDAGLGVENIWVMSWKGCQQSALSSYPDAPQILRPELGLALESERDDVRLLNAGVKEDEHRRRRRLVREGRENAKRVTNETYRYITDARFHPAGDKVIATKWYTTERSLGAGEGWEYNLPSSCHTPPISPGDGSRLIGRDLPFGWTKDQYPSQQIGPEQFIWWGKDRLIYAMNVAEVSAGAFEYSKDVYAGIYAIFSHNLTTGIRETLVDALPGGASRPELSHDGRTLAFVRRVRDKEALVLKDLISGTIHHLWYGLTYDLSLIAAPMGTYPSFSFTPNDDAVVIWAAGSIWKLPLTLNKAGERVGSGASHKIKWKATINKQLAETRYTETPIANEDTRETQRLHSFKDLSIDDAGYRAVFQGAGVNYFVDFLPNTNHSATPIPVLHPRATYYSPSFVPHLNYLVIHSRWTDKDFSSFELADLERNIAYEVGGEELPFGRYTNPVICGCNSSTRRIAFIRMGGDDMTGRIVATSGAGVYVGTIDLPASSTFLDESPASTISIRNLHRVTTVTPNRLEFVDGANRLVLHDDQTATILDLSTGADNFGKYHTKVLAEGKMSQELAVSVSLPSQGRTTPRSELSSLKAQNVAFVDFFQVYLASGSKTGAQPVWSKPGVNATKGLARLSVDGGHDLAWSKDGSRLFWLLGPYLHSIEVSKLGQCADEIKSDTSNFGISCVKKLLDVNEINVMYETDVSRIKKEARELKDASGPVVKSTEPDHSHVLIITNATLATMETGNEEMDVIHRGTVVITGGMIQNVIRDGQNFVIPQGAKVIDAQGGIVVPGFVDVHAHWSGDYTVASSWEHQIFLAYGCTTVHNPSLDNVDAWAERGRVERGLMVGPRIFTTGTIIYGAGEAQYHQDIADEDEAKSALVRIKVEGGPYSFSYKNYQLPSRASRQRLIAQAKKLGMLVVPEGGMNYDWDMTYILDGMTTVEHSLPIPVLYDDVLTLFAKSGTGHTPTHIVNYGGTFGEQYIWAHHAVPNNEKLRRFIPHETLEAITQSTSRPIDAFQLFNTSKSVYEMTKRGLNANIGAHGEPPLGLNYHAELYFFQAGGMTPYETFRSATRSGALSLGLFKSLGSITKGKLADLVVYPPGANVLENILLSPGLRYVIKGGRVWEAATLIEEWPVKGRAQTLPPLSAD